MGSELCGKEGKDKKEKNSKGLLEKKLSPKNPISNPLNSLVLNSLIL